MGRIFLAPLRHLVRSADPATPTPGAGDEYFNSTNNLKKVFNGTSWLYGNEFALPFTINGLIWAGVTGRKQRAYNRSGSPWLIIGMNLYIATAPVGQDAIGQLNKNGSSAAVITVTAGTNNANTAPGVVVNDGDFLDFDFTQVGSTIQGSDATLSVSIAS